MDMELQKKSKSLTVVIYFIYILSGLAFGIAVNNLITHSLSVQFYISGISAILLYLLGRYLWNLRVKMLKQHLEVIDYILAYRNFEENNLNNMVKGSTEWLEALKPFQEMCTKHSYTWVILLQTEMDNYKQ